MSSIFPLQKTAAGYILSKIRSKMEIMITQFYKSCVLNCRVLIMMNLTVIVHICMGGAKDSLAGWILLMGHDSY